MIIKVWTSKETEYDKWLYDIETKKENPNVLISKNIPLDYNGKYEYEFICWNYENENYDTVDLVRSNKLIKEVL